MDNETRIVEIRAASDDPGVITGIVANYGTPATIDRFTEIIEPGAFAPLSDNIRMNVQHMRDRPLARNIAGGGLTLVDSDDELRVSLELPDTTDGRDTRIMLDRKVYTGFSVEMRVTKDIWTGTERRVQSAELRAIGLVDMPAHSTALVDLEKRYQEVNPDRPVKRRRFWL